MIDSHIKYLSLYPIKSLIMRAITNKEFG